MPSKEDYTIYLMCIQRIFNSIHLIEEESSITNTYCGSYKKNDGQDQFVLKVWTLVQVIGSVMFATLKL